MSGRRWHVGPPQGYASPRRILPEVPSTSERDHSPLRSRVWCPWPGCSPISQGTGMRMGVSVGILTGWVISLCLWWWGTHFTGEVVLGWFPGHILENTLGLSFASPWEAPCPSGGRFPALQFGFASPGWRQGIHGMSGRVEGCEPPPEELAVSVACAVPCPSAGILRGVNKHFLQFFPFAAPSLSCRPPTWPKEPAASPGRRGGYQRHIPTAMGLRAPSTHPTQTAESSQRPNDHITIPCSGGGCGAVTLGLRLSLRVSHGSREAIH